MFSPEEQQIEICLLKSNLEEIENDIVGQRSALPALDAENEQKYRETMAALRVARSLNIEIERLKQENVRLTAKRLQMKQKCNDIIKSLDCARANRSHLANLLKQEENEIEQQIRLYEDSLQEKADRFRQTRGYYDEEEMNVEMDKVNNVITEVEGELIKRQNIVDELKGQVDAIHAEIPADLLTILGKTELDDKIKSLTENCDALTEKRNLLLNTETNNTQSTLNKC